MGDAGIISAIQFSNFHYHDVAVTCFVFCVMAKDGKGYVEGTSKCGSPAVSDSVLY